MKYVGCICVFMFMLCVGLYADGEVKKAELTNNKSAVEQAEEDNKKGIEDISVQEPKNIKTIVVDPGHGGPDPGKVGINQALEKDINLLISKKLEKLLIENEYKVVMTRTDDMWVGQQEEFSKVGDLSARVELINKTAPDLVISIHQNSYESEEIKGAQVFYYTHSAEGESAAFCVQNKLKELDKDNTRLIKDNDTYYLLCRTQVPTIIVECGFLSNMGEANKLVDDAYQTDVATAIVKGVEEYLQEE